MTVMPRDELNKLIEKFPDEPVIHRTSRFIGGF